MHSHRLFSEGIIISSTHFKLLKFPSTTDFCFAVLPAVLFNKNPPTASAAL